MIAAVPGLGSECALLRRFASELDEARLPARPALGCHAVADLEAARLAWAGRIVDEYRSVAIFSELLQLLADREVPFAALCAVHTLIGDELRHSRMTAQVVEWLGGVDDLAIDLADVGLPPREAGESVGERALAIVAREVVVAEEESIHALVAYRDATTEPAIRRVLALVLADEVRHAAAGRALLAIFERGALADETAVLRRTLGEQMADDRADLRARYLHSAIGGPGRALGACLEPADLERRWAQRARAPASRGARATESSA